MTSSFSESCKPPASSWCRILFPGWACVPSLLREGVEVAVTVSWGGHSFFLWKTETPYSSSGNLVAHRVHSSFLYFSLLMTFFYLITCPLGFSVPFTAWDLIVFPRFSPSRTPLPSHKLKNGRLLHRVIATSSAGKLCLQALLPVGGWRRVPPLVILSNLPLGSTSFFTRPNCCWSINTRRNRRRHRKVPNLQF